jgi:CPA1 family monovalent cation:H+ antiporter
MNPVDVVSTLLLILISAIAAFISARLTKVPLTLNILAWGMISSFIVPYIGIDTGIRADNFESLILFVLVPILVFEAALNIHSALFKPLLATILFSSTAGFLISTMVAAAILFYAIDHPVGFPWIAALIAGLMISTTDPIAVVAEMKEAKAPAKLTTLIEGESLFNDASGIVLFSLLMSIALGHSQFSFTTSLVQFLMVLFGGIGIGLVLALLAKFILTLIDPIEEYETVITLALAYGSFYCAEHVFGVSGVMAVLTAALTIKASLLATRKAYGKVHHNWQILAFLSNTVVFFLMGLVMSWSIFKEQWLAILFGIGAAFISRLVAVYISMMFGKVIFKNPVEWRYAPVMIWGGLRGVITVALALSLPSDLPYWWTIQSIAFGVVLFTLVVQASTHTFLLKKLGLSKSNTPN